MDFSLSEEQEMMKRVARDFLKEECPKSVVREIIQDEKGYSSELWRKMAGLGWQGLAFPSRYGGEGGNFLDLIIILEETGRASLPSPFFATVVLGGLSILEAGNEEQKKEFLPKVASGDMLLSLAITEPGARYEADIIGTNAVPNQDSYTITGTKIFVPFAHVADYLLCVARTDEKAKGNEGLTTFIVNTESSELTRSLLETIGRDKQCEVSFENMAVSKQDMLGKLNDGWAHTKSVLDKATVALCAGMNGGTEQILETAVEYAKGRIQFGRPIGSFQAVQHRCADMAVGLEASRALTYEAAWKISEGLPCTMEVSMAKAVANESYRQATWLAMQVQGGVSFFEEHELPQHYREAKVAEVTLGDTDLHLEKIAQQLLN